jgi:hypothetical protein
MSLWTEIKDEIDKFEEKVLGRVGAEVHSDISADATEAKAQVATVLSAAGHDVTEDAAQVAGQAGSVATEASAAVTPEQPSAPAAS